VSKIKNGFNRESVALGFLLGFYAGAFLLTREQFMDKLFGRAAFLVLAALTAMLAFGCAAATSPSTQPLTAQQEALNNAQSALNTAQFALSAEEIVASVVKLSASQQASLNAFDVSAQNAINTVQADINAGNVPTAEQDLSLLATAIANYRNAVTAAKTAN